VVHLFNRITEAETQAQPQSQALKQTRTQQQALSMFRVVCFCAVELVQQTNFPKGKIE